MLASLVGCATRPTQPKALSYEDLTHIDVNRYKCKDIDWVVSNMEQQLRIKGLLDANPEDLSDDDRKYNAMAQIGRAHV